MSECPNCKRYRAALEKITDLYPDTDTLGNAVDIANAALAPSPEELGETPLFRGV